MNRTFLLRLLKLEMDVVVHQSVGDEERIVQTLGVVDGAGAPVCIRSSPAPGSWSETPWVPTPYCYLIM